MTTFKPVYNPEQFELRSYTNSYLTAEQSESIDLVENRVNGQFDWLAQMLGWNGPDYWTNLTSNVSQKRRILGGTFGVYNSFIFPRVLAVRNWDSTSSPSPQAPLLQREIYLNNTKLWFVIEKDNRIELGQELFIGQYTSSITSLREENNTYIIQVEGDVEIALSEFQAGQQLKIAAPDERPEPFYRPSIASAGDATFHCARLGQTFALYPLWDLNNSLPYVFDTLMVGATYWFDQPVYIARDETRIIDEVVVNYPRDIVSTYDSEKNLWYLSVPLDFNPGELGVEAHLVWLYSESGIESFCVKELNLQRWKDPSDWYYTPVLNNYTGAWGNKGGFLPFNFVLDSLEINGFDEQKSVYMTPLTNYVSFDKLLNFVYYQKVATDPVSPGIYEDGQIWWDSSDGSFSVWRDSPYRCGTWEEVTYPEPAVDENSPEVVYPDVLDFRFSSNTVAPGTVVQIEDISGLTISDDVIGVSGTLSSPARVKLFRATSDSCWTPLQFEYADELDFDADAEKLPFQVPVKINNGVNLGIYRVNYTIINLKFVISEPLPVELVKTTGNLNWEIAPVSSLKYIGNTRLFASNPSPVDGALNWNYDEPVEELRRAVVFYYSGYEFIGGEWVLQGAWVDINTGEAVDPPSTDLNFGTIKVYCDGQLVEEEDTYQTDNFTFYYDVDANTGEFVFKYDPLSFYGAAILPKIEISDSLTGTFRYDISEYVFSGISYYLSPNTLDCQTPLRVWKSQSLQVEGQQVYEKEGNYSNILRADDNNGPQAVGWDKYFLRLPPSLERNGSTWQKVALVCQDFGYWGSSVDPEEMDCPSEDDVPRLYEQVFLLRETPTESYVMYSEPYLFSDIIFGGNQETGDYENAAILPAIEIAFDQFTEGSLKVYEPLHERKAITNLPVGKGYGEWEGIYLRPADCADLSGFLTNDLLSEAVYPLTPPLWDSSIYKLPPSCEVDKEVYTVDTNHYKIGYAYFAADMSCAEDGFFDIHQEAAWRYPVTRDQTLYITPGVKHYSLTA